MSIRKRVIDNSVEEKILIGLIISDRICRETLHLIKRDTFQNPYTQTVAKWIKAYHKKYRKAPKQTIQDVFNVEQKNLKEEEIDFIVSFLSRLSEEFEDEDTPVNEDYLIDKSLEYFKKSALKNISEKIDSCIELDKIDEAEKALQGYRQISKEMSKFIDPFSDEEVNKFFADQRDNVNKMFRMNGALGDLIGDFERGTLVGVMGPAKRGKSFILIEIAVQAFMERFKVLFVSLEMNTYKMKRRFFRRLTAFGEEEKDYVYPCFDCWKNQMNICTKSKRTNHVKLRDAEGDKPTEFDPQSDYRPCVACRGEKDFLPDNWFTMIRRPKQNVRNTKKHMQGLRQMFSENFRLICYPKFSANVSQLKSDIETLEYEQDFIPDVIVIDYADILAPEDNRVTGRDRYDETWKMFGNLGDVRKALVVTASQTNRASFNKKNVTQVDAAEDIRKIANVEVMLSLNQSQDEKREGVMRVAVVAGRDEDFNEYKTCTILQNLTLGQVCLDSEMYTPKKKEDKK